MKNSRICFFALLMIVLAACSTQKKFDIYNDADDAYWRKADDLKKPLTVQDLERSERSNRGPSQGYQNYKPNNQAPPAQNYDQPSGYDNARAQSSYDAWNKQRGMSTGSGNSNNIADSVNYQPNSLSNNKNDERDTRNRSHPIL